MWEDGIRMDLREIGLGGCGLDSTGSGQGPVAGCCECGDEPSGSYATELVIYICIFNVFSVSFCIIFLSDDGLVTSVSKQVLSYLSNYYVLPVYHTVCNFVRFQVLTAAGMKVTGFWDTTQCSLKVCRRFRGSFCLYHKDHHRPDNGGSTYL
jgi:hypothetical protein